MRLVLPAATVLLLAACSPPSGGEAGAETGPGPDQGRPAAPSAAPPQPSLPTTRTSSGVDEPCTLENTVGIWRLTHIEAAEPGVQDFYRTAPHEYLRIRPGGAYAYFATNAPVTATGDLNGRLDQADDADGVNDVADFRQPGLFVILRDGQPFQAFRCVIAGGAQGRHQAGDMVWTEYQGMPRLYRVQRRLQ